jgi:hypothetical protein
MWKQVRQYDENLGRNMEYIRHERAVLDYQPS